MAHKKGSHRQTNTLERRTVNVASTPMDTSKEKLVKTHLGHVVMYGDQQNVGFYRDLFGYLGWTTVYDEGGILGISDGGQYQLYFEGESNGTAHDHDGTGLNHLAVITESQADVDAASTWLRSKGVELLYGTPCNRPEHAESENHLYYSAMFESPDRILLEVVYTGPK
jgi:catechol 2,3-dioxygenase-like lactoylglutathione lyase family enzyme